MRRFAGEAGPRRANLIVDALEKAPNQRAFLALRDARDAINTTLDGLGPSDRALTEDLLARITAAISPCFE